MIQIAFSGASSTGKTTIVNLLNNYLMNKGYKTHVISNVIRNSGIKLINEQATVFSQLQVMSTFVAAHNNIPNNTGIVIHERSLWDVVAWTENINYYMMNEMYVARVIKELAFTFGRYNFTFYLPREIELKIDEFRSADESYHNKIDSTLVGLLNHYQQNQIEIRGTPEERLATILLKTGL